MKRRKVITLLLSYALILAVVLSLAYWGSEAVSVINNNKPIINANCVIIDAGHGGIDGGATSVTGVLEKDLNLQIARRLEDLLHLLGISTVMVRTTDDSIHSQGNTISEIKVSDLKNRVSMVNGIHNGILVSIHQNYFSQSQYSGPQSFYAKTDGSKELAIEMQKAFVNNLAPISKRKAKKSDGVYLMDKVQCKAILIECGFISNYEEEQRLIDANYQKKLCAVMASVLSTTIKDDPIA